jgi:hypothetical protein
MAAAASPDPRLLSLIPPNAALIAGISSSSFQDQPDNFVLMTHNNLVDLEDFYALTGADGTRNIHQIVLVAVANNDGQPKEHSLLASGHFDQPHVFRSVADGGAAVTNYRGIPVLEIPPFARERGMFHDVRWLAVLDSSVLVFGSIASMRLELDRYLAHSHTEESLLRRLGRLRSKDQTWCLLSASIRTTSSPARDQEIHRMLAELNPELAELSQFADEFEFGMHYGRHVEFEYEVVMSSRQRDSSERASLLASSPQSPQSASLLPDLNIADAPDVLHGVIEVSASRYKDWLARVTHARSPLN